MAELASGAVSSLLVVIRNEALLLRGVQDDVQFIKEEMESMKSFLAHLARSAPPGGEHDEQVRTWMTQVRLLAQDCNNCIDLYLYRGNPDIHRARGGIRRYVWWVSWFLHKMAAQHRAAIQLRQLKDRARDVGERRLRYGVEVPGKSTTLGQSPHVAAGGYATADDEEDRDEEDQTAKIQLVTPTTHHYGPRAFFEPRSRDDYVKAKLLEWVSALTAGAGETLSIAIVAPDTDRAVLDLAQKTLVVPLFPPAYTNPGYHRGILVNIPAVHLNTFFFPVPLRPKEVLYYILRELKHAKSRSHKQDIDQSKGEDEEKEPDFWQAFNKKRDIYLGKKRVIHKIKEKIKNMKVYEKLDRIEREIRAQQQKGNQQQLFQQDLGQKKGLDKLDLVVLLQMLLHPQQDQAKNRDMQTMPVWDDNTIVEIAKKFKEYMEADEKANELKEETGAEEKEDTAKQEKEEDDGGVERKEEKGDKMEEEKRGGERNKEEKKEGGRQYEEEQLGGGREEQENEEGDKREEEKGEEGVEMKEEKGGRDEEEKGEDGVEMEEDKGGDKEEKGDKIEETEEEEQAEEENEDNNDNVEDNKKEEDQEDQEEEGPIYLHQLQYEQILREVFPMQAQPAKQASKITTTTLDEEQIKKMINEAKQEVLRELQEGKPDKNQATGEPCQNQNVGFEEIAQKIKKIKWELKEQLKIKGIVDKIKKLLGDECPLIILKVDEMMDGSRWEDVRKALSLLDCSADALIFTTSESIQEAKGYCYPPREPIDYSLVGLYHDTVLELTSKQKNEDNFDPQVFRDILECCFFSKDNLEYEPHEFCMKIFTHALYANSNRSSEELIKLRSTLQALPKSFDIRAKKMFMYSYNDLPKEYKSCLLYLAIFPKGQKIRRSDLIGRWVAEGLIVKEDWPSSVKQARRCFDALIRRWLVYPVDIGATGKVKSCVVGDLVHGFITTIARKQHFVETRLSHHLARHFSVFNDLQLRSSDRIDKFFQDLSKSYRVSLLKVLDLEGCKCFGGKNQRYLKDICTKMLLLKYLSLRGTDITQLPSEINYLRELEVLDIRQTKVPAQATANILLLKLKRLLAGDIDPSSSNFGSVQIPHRIGKMVKVEVLSNVKALNNDDLKDIGKLWQLRKLEVVISDKDSQLENLLQTISDLHECLRSLSITLPTAASCKDTPSSVKLPNNIGSCLKQNPKILESLSIRGTTLKGHLLPVITNGGNNKLAKCVRLHHIDCTEGKLTFKKDRFISLKCLFVEGSDLTNITFEDEAACELEKMVLSFTSTESISGVDRLPKLEELELNNSSGRLLSSFENTKQIAKLTLRGTLLDQDALKILANKPNIRCLVLLDKSFLGSQNQITFNKDEFIWLNLLDVHCSSITKIVFTSGSAPRLEKIVWSSFASLSGIENLPRLKELEFNGKDVPNEVTEAIKKHKNKPSLKDNAPETQDQAKGDEEEDDDDDARFPFCWKKQV
ncbi:hypothetical protein SETIT_7G271300v2 [Setaria italica]|uniref:Uncharacterized protein n=1 Tax=Setaria italica TaxID=4555 RepID=A0A368S0A6_SETIT|nr:uncharacterized protein LOC101766437 [Setaria italica]RCV35831.1 hypothetical protein SETIT_7G271300v2 [Setaria italica]